MGDEAPVPGACAQAVETVDHVAETRSSAPTATTTATMTRSSASSMASHESSRWTPRPSRTVSQGVSECRGRPGRRTAAVPAAGATRGLVPHRCPAASASGRSMRSHRDYYRAIPKRRACCNPYSRAGLHRGGTAGVRARFAGPPCGEEIYSFGRHRRESIQPYRSPTSTYDVELQPSRPGSGRGMSRRLLHPRARDDDPSVRA